MKVKNIILTIVAIAVSMISAVAQNFSYQAVVRNTDGTILAGEDVTFRLSLINGSETCYVESHNAKTTSTGNVTLLVGAGKAEKGEFAKVPWSTMSIMMKSEVKTSKSASYIDLGTFQINQVPYAMYAKETSGEIVANTTNSDEALFVIKNKGGQPVFAVYPNNVVVYVDEAEEGKAVKSGFAITKRTTGAKEATADYFTVSPEGTKVYVDDAEEGKAVKSGFAITKRTTGTKAEENYLEVNGEGTRFYVDGEDSKAVKSGFAITKRTTGTKADNEDIFVVNESGTEVRIDDPDDESKAVKSGFAIVSKKKPANKDGENFNYFSINDGTTSVFVQDGENTQGFAVANRATQQPLMTFTNEGVDVKTNVVVQGSMSSEGEMKQNVSPKGWYSTYAIGIDDSGDYMPKYTSIDLKVDNDTYVSIWYNAFRYMCTEYGKLEIITLYYDVYMQGEACFAGIADTYVLNHNTNKMLKIEDGDASDIDAIIGYYESGSYKIMDIPAELQGRPLFYVDDKSVAGYVPSDTLPSYYPCYKFNNGYDPISCSPDIKKLRKRDENRTNCCEYINNFLLVTNESSRVSGIFEYAAKGKIDGAGITFSHLGSDRGDKANYILYTKEEVIEEGGYCNPDVVEPYPSLDKDWSLYKMGLYSFYSVETDGGEITFTYYENNLPQQLVGSYKYACADYGMYEYFAITTFYRVYSDVTPTVSDYRIDTLRSTILIDRYKRKYTVVNNCFADYTKLNDCLADTTVKSFPINYTDPIPYNVESDIMISLTRSPLFYYNSEYGYDIYTSVDGKNITCVGVNKGNCINTAWGASVLNVYNQEYYYQSNTFSGLIIDMFCSGMAQTPFSWGLNATQTIYDKANAEAGANNGTIISRNWLPYSSIKGE